MNRFKNRRLLCFLLALMILLASFMPTASRVSAEDENVQTVQTETEDSGKNEDGDETENAPVTDDTEEDASVTDEAVGDMSAEDDTEEDMSVTDEAVGDTSAEDGTEEDASVTDEAVGDTSAEDGTKEDTSATEEQNPDGKKDDTESEEAVEFRYQKIRLFPSDGNREVTVTLNGMMPEGATATASDMIEEKEEAEEQAKEENKEDNKEGNKEGSKEEKDAEKLDAVIGALGEIEGDAENGKSVVSAYDITILDGEEEYQPDEERPIHVQISDPAILGSGQTELWHIRDDGQKERIPDFTVEEGRISFYAKSFSVYAVAEFEDTTMIGQLKEKGKTGFYTKYSVSGTPAGQYYYIDGATNEVPKQGGRTGIGSTAISSTVPAGAVKLYYEYIEGTEDQFYIYKLVGEDSEKDREYIEMYTGSFGDGARGALRFTSVRDDRSAFKLNENAGTLKISATVNGTTYYWNGNKPNYKEVVGYTKETDVNTAKVVVEVEEPQPLEWDGLTYGILSYTAGVSGTAMMAATSGTGLSKQEVLTKANPLTHDGVVLIALDKDISMWTFHAASDGSYTISTPVGEETRYLKLDGDTLKLADESEATGFTITSGGGSRKNKIKISHGEKAICFDNAFKAAKDDNSAKFWLNLAELSNLADDDFEVYSSAKVGVSEVKNGAKVIVYTRVWNPKTTSYEFYAIDHDGSLVPCYERGDNIMWIGSKVNTLEWDFTEYYWEGTQDPNYYYELCNTYSGKYLAPQIREGQMLSDKKIGINLPGRKEGEYYSQILAWDDDYYAYAGLKASDDKDAIVSCTRSKAATFYFATINTPEQVLTTVDTIDNKQYGITMKMADYNGPTETYDGATTTKLQHEVLGYSKFVADVPTEGLISTNLDSDGYPTAMREESKRPFSDLFKDATEVNHLFVASTYEASGYFEYDSCQNFATLKETNDGNFKVYEALATTDKSIKPSLQHGQFMPYNTIAPGVYASKNAQNLYDAKLKALSENDPRKYERLNLVDNDTPDYYFGMELDARFVKTPKGVDAWGHDIIFEFTGDDDFWLYVDGELVIDLGGIHSALEGTVNFSTGDVKVNGVATNLRDIFRKNFISRNPSATTEEISAFLSQYFSPGEDGDFEKYFKDYSPHTMKVFFMERGAGASNLHMRFNLNYVTPGNVTLKKEVSQPQGTNMDLDLVEYPFRIWYRKEDGTEELLSNDDENVNVTYLNTSKPVEYKDSYTPAGCTSALSSVYFLSPDRGVEIHFPDKTIEYKIEECGLNHAVYNKVSINGTEVSGAPVEAGNAERLSYSSGWVSVKDRPNITFNNQVNPEGLRTLSVTKRLYDEENRRIDADQDDTTYSFRLSLSNGVDEEMELASMYKYRVKDPSGNYCRWSAADQKFISLDETDFEQLTEDEQESATFETSMNGTISKIPAWYTVEVPILPVDMKYELVERTDEVPLGYQLVKYERTDEGHENDPEPNRGVIIKGEAPRLFVENRRGWELQADKDWTDRNYIKDYAPIYTAVYIGDELVPGTVKRMKYPNTSVRYFFEKLADGKELSDYRICEVTVENPVVDNETDIVTSYSSLTKLEDGDVVPIEGTAKDGSTSNHSYGVEYTTGTSEGKMTPGNVRKDKISNVRTGGIVITLYKWASKEKLAGGTFVLKKGEETVGTYTADSHGRVTILYDFDIDTEYELTETTAPAGYIGLPRSVKFTVDGNDEIEVVENETGWYRGYKSTVTTDKLIAYIDLYNKPYEFRAVKVDDLGTPLAGAHFALYRGVSSGQGVIRDYYPMEGFEDLVSGADGTIPKIDKTLPHGRYYLSETETPAGYQGITKDVIFTISDSGVVSLDANGQKALLRDEGTDDAPSFVLSVENTLGGNNSYLTITKTVDGNFGNKMKEFTFTLDVEGASEQDAYIWSLNGVKQDTDLRSGGTFTMRHNDVVRIAFPTGTKVTVREDNKEYAASFKLNEEEAKNTNTMKIEMTADSILAVTNSLEGIVPTGIHLDFVNLALMAMLFLCGVVIFYRRSRKRKLKD